MKKPKLIEYQLPQFLLVKEDSPIISREVFTTSRDAYNLLRQLWKTDLEIYESVYAIYLNRGNRPVGWMRISQGGISSSVVDTKLIAKNAINSLASGVIIAHNHPSGNLKPSQSDLDVTRQLADCLLMVDSKLMDHLILAGDSFLSFRDEGLL